MMNTKFNKSGVLTSVVDFFCLLCEYRLNNENDAVAHIAKPIHSKNLNLMQYFGAKEDHIRKVKKGYYCELCNQFLLTASKVRLHITELMHIKYRNNEKLQRKGNIIVALSNVQIFDKAWNGITDESCVICNVEYENEAIHINEPMHIIKLLQSNIEFIDRNVYRKIDGDSFQCLTCNKISTFTKIEEHFNQPEHVNLYQKAYGPQQNDNLQMDKKGNSNLNDDKNRSKTEKNNKALNSTSDNKTLEITKTSVSKSVDTVTKHETSEKFYGKNGAKKKNKKGKIQSSSGNMANTCDEINIQNLRSDIKTLPKQSKDGEPNDNDSKSEYTNQENVEQAMTTSVSIENYQKKAVIKNNIEVYTNSATQKKKNVEPAFKHVSNNANAENTTDKVKIEISLNELVKFANDNFLIYSTKSNIVECPVCHIKIPPNLCKLKEHIAEDTHLHNTKKKKLIIPKVQSYNEEFNLTKNPIGTFLINFGTITGLRYNDVIINDDICITVFSFMLLVNNGNTIECLVCKTEEDASTVPQHIMSAKHKQILDICVVECFGEFIREISPNNYHCGYCNVLKTPWNNMRIHLENPEHKKCMTNAQWRLKEHKSHVLKNAPENREHFNLSTIFDMYNED